MKRSLTAAALVAAALGCLVRSGAAAPAAAPTPLPDSAVMARVDDRVIRVYDFRERYFTSDGDSRPPSDSLGRVQFLQTMIDKECMGLTALKAGKLNAADELSLQQALNTTMEVAVFQMNVAAKVHVTEKDLKAIHPQYGWQLRLRYLLLPDSATAAFVHGRLVRGQLPWSEAARKYSRGPDSLVTGDLGWKLRTEVPGAAAAEIFELRPPNYSNVIRDDDGFKIWQCLDRRTVELPAYRAVRRALLSEVASAQEARYKAAFYGDMRARSNATFDTTNVTWLAEYFRIANASAQAVQGTLDMRGGRVPTVPLADTSRVLATSTGVVMTAGRFLILYKDIPPLRRHKIETPAALFDILEAMVLEPAILALAKDQHYENAPMVQGEMARRREALLVQHLYADSVESRVFVTDAMRRKFYDEHRNDLRTREHVVYAIVVRKTEAGIDSVIARLDKGETAAAILAADSLAGMRLGSIRELYEGQPHQYRTILMEELKQGQSTKQYLGADKLWIAFNIVLHEPSRSLSYEESRDTIQEALENSEAERLLTEMLARLRKRHHVESHPRWVMRIALTDPVNDWNIPSGE